MGLARGKRAAARAARRQVTLGVLSRLALAKGFLLRRLSGLAMENLHIFRPYEVVQVVTESARAHSYDWWSTRPLVSRKKKLSLFGTHESRRVHSYEKRALLLFSSDS